VKSIRGDGDVIAFVLISVDVTHETSLEAALGLTQEQLRLTIAATGIGLWRWSRSDDIIVWDETCRRLFGVETAPARYAEYLALIHPEDRDRIGAQLATFMATGIYRWVEHRVTHPGGEVRWLLGVGQVMRDERGQVTGILGGTIDITDRKRLEEQLVQAQKMRAVGQLTAGMAHNFNNLLMAILSNLELARRDSFWPVQELLDGAVQATLRAADIMRQLTTFARQRLPSERVEVAAAVEQVVAICRGTFSSRIELESRVASDLPVVHLPLGTLEQALMNLLLNARDAVEDRIGSPQRIEVVVEQATAVELATVPVPGERPYLRIRVSDSGSGMSEEVRAHLFEPFFTTKEVGKGTGLGLATAYALVRDVGGLLQCERTGASGTVFAIYVPADPSAGRSEAAALGPLVLIVEHDDAVRRSIARVLSSSGFQVLEAATGSAAQSLWRQHPGVALVLLEQSPQAHHRDVLAALRKELPGAALVALATSGADAVGDDCYAAVLSKPVRVDELVETVRAALPSRP
jgi:PAS domain S-box-containing protein